MNNHFRLGLLLFRFDRLSSRSPLALVRGFNARLIIIGVHKTANIKCMHTINKIKLITPQYMEQVQSSPKSGEPNAREPESEGERGRGSLKPNFCFILFHFKVIYHVWSVLLFLYNLSSTFPSMRHTLNLAGVWSERTQNKCNYLYSRRTVKNLFENKFAERED